MLKYFDIYIYIHIVVLWDIPVFTFLQLAYPYSNVNSLDLKIGPLC